MRAVVCESIAGPDALESERSSIRNLQLGTSSSTFMRPYYGTAYYVVVSGKLQPGETIFVTGAAGMVGCCQSNA